MVAGLSEELFKSASRQAPSFTLRSIAMPKTTIPSDFPNEHRLGDAALFRELLGRPGKSTFARYLQIGLIPPPDAKLGALNRWRETTIAAAVKALPKARERHAADGQAGKDSAHAGL
jgi:hypothetical protein